MSNVRDLTTIRRDMGDSVPRYYTDSVIVGNLFDRESNEIGSLNAAVYDVLDQFFIDTATWGISNWERVCNITVDETKPMGQRRSVLKSKLLGIGMVTVPMLQSVAQAFDRGTIEVTEQPDLYQFTVKFADTLGAPPYINEMKAAIEDVKPAHLAVVYVFKYLFVNQVSGVMTISQIQARKLTDFSPFVTL